MKGEVLEFAKQLNDKAVSFSSNQQKISKFLDFYIAKNNLTDAVLIGTSRNVLARHKLHLKLISRFTEQILWISQRWKNNNFKWSRFK